LILGGYGVVGRRIAARLGSEFPDHVIIAGRDPAAAEAACREIGHGCRARRIDIDDRASVGGGLDGVGTVVSCVAQHHRHVMNAALELGLAYTDVAPQPLIGANHLREVDRARASGACIVLGAGLSPGVSNMMARRLAALVASPERVETAILLSLGDEYGRDSLRYVVEAAARPFSVFEGGRPRRARAFSEGRRVDFGVEVGARTAYLFPWSDVVSYPETLGVLSSVGRFALHPPWAGTACGWLVASGVVGWMSARLQENPTGQIPALDLIKRLYSRDDRFALVVSMSARGGEHRARLTGRNQTEVTAAAAAEFGRLLASREVEAPGVWLPEQVVMPDPFFERLAALGYRTTTESTAATGAP
jgi:saccharopine dehydrogenase-like NADP-dependent oxidoreductase